ncbi:MAG: hypothetical protein IJX80_00285 [Clostridia bacterium]|nr:hypothetical protein [Clostridia bacterium]
MKKTMTLMLALVLTVVSCGFFTGCAATPQVEDLYDRVVYLVEKAYELNSIFYGPGLPVYESGSEYVELNHVYFGFDQKDNYEYVTPQSKFQTIDQIKLAAEKVYSKGFLEDVLYKAAFDGYAIDNSAGGTAFGLARYQEFSGVFCQSLSKDADGKDNNTLYTAMRIYDYSSMEMLSLGRENACKVSMRSWLEDSPEQVDVVEIAMILQDGEWFLDSFTGA